MQYTSGDSHYIETSSVARDIDAFNEQIRESGYMGSERNYEEREADYIGDVQAGNYTSDYKRIQIANAIERINSKIAHMKPSIDGRVMAPGEEAQGMAMDMAPSGSESYRNYYIQEMAKRVARGEHEDVSSYDTGAYEGSIYGDHPDMYPPEEPIREHIKPSRRVNTRSEAPSACPSRSSIDPSDRSVRRRHRKVQPQ